MLSTHFRNLCKTRGSYVLLRFIAVVILFLSSSVGQAKVFVARNIQCDPDSKDMAGSQSRLAIAVEQGDTFGRVTVGAADEATRNQSTSLLGTAVARESDQSTFTEERSTTEAPDLFGLTVAVEATDGSELNVSALQFAVDLNEQDCSEYLVYSFADGCSWVDLLTADSVDSADEDGGLKQFCRLDLEGLAFKDAKRVEFRIYPMGGVAQAGLTFDEIAVDGYVTQAPMPPALAVWGGVLLITFLAGYTLLFLLWSNRARVVAQTADSALMTSLSEEGQEVRRFGGNWSDETRQAILDVLSLPSRR